LEAKEQAANDSHVIEARLPAKAGNLAAQL